MIEAEIKYSSGPWNGSKSQYSIDQLKRAVPKGMLRRANRIAAAAKRDVTKDDLALPYREKNGDANINGISAALGRIDQVKDATPAELASSRTELESERAKARKALGLDKPKRKLFGGLENLQELGANFISQLAANRQQSAASSQRLAPGILSLAEDSGYHTMSAGSAAAAVRATAASVRTLVPPIKGELVALAEKRMSVSADKTIGVIDSDFRPVPNWRKLGIDRPAGDATPEELALLGATKLDGTAFQPTDVYSTGALLISNDVIEKYGAFWPVVELERLRHIMATRLFSSDQDHDHKSMSATFKIVQPATGTDPGTMLHADHPLLGKVPYTAVIARLLYPKIQEDPDQMAAVAAAMAGKLRDKSLAWASAHFSCGLCGEMPISNAFRDSSGNILGFKIPPESNLDLMMMDPETLAYENISGTIRTPDESVAGGYAYNDVRVLAVTQDGTVQIEAVPETYLGLAKGSVFMVNMDQMMFLWMSGGYYCRAHKGKIGQKTKDGRKMIAQFTQTRALINCAEANRGASGDARAVPDPDSRY